MPQQLTRQTVSLIAQKMLNPQFLPVIRDVSLSNLLRLQLSKPRFPLVHKTSFPHFSHTHSNVTISTGTYAHGHGASPTSLVVCGAGCTTYTHNHGIVATSGSSHTHSVTLSFGAADLGSPWWAHVHPISLVSIGNGGGAHVHAVNCISGFCVTCWFRGHVHVDDMLATSNNDQHNDHTVNNNTQNADSGETAENHFHPFSVNSGFGGVSHTHPIAGGIFARTCLDGCNHNHTTPTVTNPAGDNHRHLVAGDSGTGGEAPPPPAVKAGLNIPEVLKVLCG